MFALVLDCGDCSSWVIVLSHLALSIWPSMRELNVWAGVDLEWRLRLKTRGAVP